MTSSQLSERGFRSTAPFQMVWLATNQCSARCHHCSSASAKRGPDELETAEAVDMLRQFAAFGVLDLSISGGEPLLRKDLLEIIQEARHLGISVGVGSNGASLGSNRARDLMRAGVNRYQVSLDGLPDQHDRLRAWPGLFDRSIRSLAEAAEAGLRTHVCCTIHKGNAETLEEFAETVVQRSVRQLNFSRFVPTGRGDSALDLPDADWQGVIRRVVGIKEQLRGRMEVRTHLAQTVLVDLEAESMSGFIGCQAGIGQGCVTANGTVTPCVLLPIPLGNLREATFAEIWSQAEVNRALRDRNSFEGRCADCEMRDRCGGCRAVAFARTGRIFAEDPRCWHRSCFKS